MKRFNNNNINKDLFKVEVNKHIFVLAGNYAKHSKDELLHSQILNSIKEDNGIFTVIGNTFRGHFEYVGNVKSAIKVATYLRYNRSNELFKMKLRGLTKGKIK